MKQEIIYHDNCIQSKVRGRGNVQLRTFCSTKSLLMLVLPVGKTWFLPLEL